MKILNATRITTAVFGITLALGGMHHGFYEILQGNNPTGNLIIHSISPEYQRWDNGEEAFTLIPNFQVTGILAITVSVAIVIWSLAFIHRKNGLTVFLLLFLLLTLVGGGIGHVVFFLPVWGYATRMNKPLNWWKKRLGLASNAGNKRDPVYYGAGVFGIRHRWTRRYHNFWHHIFPLPAAHIEGTYNKLSGCHLTARFVQPVRSG